MPVLIPMVNIPPEMIWCRGRQLLPLFSGDCPYTGVSAAPDQILYPSKRREGPTTVQLVIVERL